VPRALGSDDLPARCALGRRPWQRVGAGLGGAGAEGRKQRGAAGEPERWILSSELDLFLDKVVIKSVLDNSSTLKVIGLCYISDVKQMQRGTY